MGEREWQAAYGKFKALEASQCYLLRSPEIREKSLVMTFAGDPSEIRKIQRAFNGIKIPYKVGRLSELKDSENAPFGQLTMTQTQVLRLAHAMGYYDIPRKTSTYQLARMLKMDKGTVGRHLRRAERNMLNSLFA